YMIFFFQAEDGIRDRNVTGVQTCALPISREVLPPRRVAAIRGSPSWTRTNDTAVNSRVLYRLSYGGMWQALVRNKSLCWRYLFSRAVASQVLSAGTSLTTVFGMGTGGPSP